MAQIAYNPITREAHVLMGEKWVPTQVARAEDGTLYALAGNSWEAFDAPKIHAKDMLISAVKNSPQSAVNYGRGLVEPLLSPIETAKNLGNIIAGGAQKVTGSSLGMDDRTQYADALVNEMKDRYGSVEDLKRTFATDPVGVAGDAATLLAGGGAALKAASAGGKVAPLARAGEMAAQAATFADPVGLLGKAVMGLPEKVYGVALKPSPQLGLADRAAVVATGLEKKIPVTLGGYDKLDGMMNREGRALDAALMSRNEPIISPQATAGKVYNQTMTEAATSANPTKSIDLAQAVYGEHLTDPLVPDLVTPKQANEYKRDFQQQAKTFYGDTRPPIEGRAKKDIARAYKNEIEAAIPGVGPINKRLSDLIELEDQLASAVGRVSNRNIFSLPALIAGAQVGPSGQGIASMLGLPWTASEIAFGLDNLRRGEVGLPKAGILGRPLRLSVNDRALLNAIPTQEDVY